MKAYVLGGTGYTGGELIRLLTAHPEIDSFKASSRSKAGELISDSHPNLKCLLDQRFIEYESSAVDADVVFCCLPHKASMKVLEPLIESGHRVIDLSADFRFEDEKIYRENYASHACPMLLGEAVYGLPELYREEIRKTSLVANPGCYATAAILALLPLMKQRGLDLTRIVVDAKSGTSGAGAKPNVFLNSSETAANLKPYKVTGHRHQPEIDHILSRLNPDVSVNFTPTLAPFTRGIQETIHIFGEPIGDPRKAYEDHYKNECFVRVVSDSFISNVVHSNFCDIAVFYDEGKRRLVTVSCIDNLIKGAAGQAIQNMNLMLGFKESKGLMQIPYHP
ncbi:MAG: N-acetyl-gamma-glutamyl-phosphate reductase [Candidatus Altiarchaeales archaeon]|nr:N-acetyl-gamma-glutamyl-phosphate reductase [Candidatus Altiarchaeales archaeon]